MTYEQLKNRFPNASESFLRANSQDRGAGLRPLPEKSNGQLPLVKESPTEETRWHDAACLFEITFIVYAVRPADADGYDIKAILDFCKEAGIIPDDRWDIVSFVGTASRKAATEIEERTEIQIKEIK